MRSIFSRYNSYALCILLVFVTIIMHNIVHAEVIPLKLDRSSTSLSSFHVETDTSDIHTSNMRMMPGDNEYTPCGGADGMEPASGEGLFNTATLDTNNDGIADVNAEACADVPIITLDKTFVESVTNSDGTIAISYQIIVVNIGGTDGEYSLSDAPSFDDDATILSANFTSDIGLNGALDATNTNWVLASSQAIAAGDEHIFSLVVDVSISLSDATGDNEYTACGSNGGANPEANEGFFNEALLDVTGDGVPDLLDTICPDIAFHDIALRKTIVTTSSYTYGDVIEYAIEVFNQGNTDISNVTIIDYLPCGLTFDASLNTGWALSNGDITTTYSGIINPASSATVTAFLVLTECDSAGAYYNPAEVAAFEDTEGNQVLDIDSTPDTDPDNDGPPIDDVITDSNDEDDHDIAELDIYDLAIRKLFMGMSGPFQVGQTANFAITIYNQGNVPAYNIEIIDYINVGFRLSPTDPNGWTSVSSGIATNTYAGPLMPNTSHTISVELIVQPGAMDMDLDNFVEITSSDDDQDITNDPPSDIDSEADTDPDNDDNIDNEIDNPADEDDHDGADVIVFDLALAKTLNNTIAAQLGDMITFDILVINQGDVAATNILITDYVPAAYSFNATNDARWQLNAITGNYEYLITEALMQGDTISVPIQLDVTDVTDFDALINIAEITSSEDLNGNDVSLLDIDSFADDDPTNDIGGVVNTADDNNTTGAGNIGEDEDDHDPATVPIYDLALMKVANNNDPAVTGQVTTFTITVHNQGNSPVTNIAIADYLSDAFALSPNDSNGWRPQNADSTIYQTSINGFNLLPGDELDVEIDLIILATANPNNLINYAEIAEYTNLDNIVVSPFDIDSDADYDAFNDIGGEANSPTDNLITDDGKDSDLDGVIDEDDHDPAAIPFYDLALIKTTTLEAVELTDVVEFQIQICNQGDEDAQNIVVTDYVPTGLAFVTDGRNAAWDATDPLNPTYTHAGPLLMTECFTFSIFLEVIDDTPANLINMAEIASSENTAGEDRTNSDFDSTADNDNTNDNGNEPYSIFDDVNDQNGLGGGDEDDHDQAWLLVCQEISCKSELNISLDENCSVDFTASMVLTPAMYPDSVYTIVITDIDGNIIDGIFTADDIGEMFFVSVSIPQCDMLSCWSTITVEDKFAPVIDCPGDMTVSCVGLDGVPDPTVVENCGSYDLVLLSQTEDDLGGCDANYSKRVTRTYQATDDQGNVSPECTFDIFLERIDLSDVVFPTQNYQAQLGTAFECGGNYALDANGNPDPSVAGVPTYQGLDLFPDAPMIFCNGFVRYEDTDLGTVGCVRTISRVWTVGEWHCGGDMIRMGAQVIQIDDTKGPTITCPTDMTVSTNNGVNNCESMVTLPSITAADDCNMPVEVDIIYPGGFIDNQNGGIAILPTGANTVTYVVYDDCYNSSSCSMTVTVQDENQPIALCTSNTVVAINSAGTGILKALEVDNGSFDDCGIDRYEVQRMTDNCGNLDDLELGSEVTFCCADVGTEQMVLFRVYDTGGNYNECMVTVAVQDKQLPILSCPQDVTVACTTVFDFANLDLPFGAASVVDNCASGTTISQTYVDSRDDCGLGVMTRTFSVSDGQGDTIRCDQRVVFNNPNPYAGPTAADWPVDVTFNNDVCNLFDLQPENLPAGMNTPVINEDNCDQVAVSFEDEVFTFTPGEDACYKVLRTWTVIDWCSRNPDNTIPQYVHEQVLKVTNSIAPTITSSTDDVVVETFDTACAAGNIDLILTATDDCTEAANLSISYTIDLDSDGSIDLTGNTNDASGNYNIGIHTISWSVLDGCGNITTADYTFEIRNAKSPQPICIQGLSTDLVPMDLDNDGTPDTEMVMLQPEFFDAGSNHPCGYAVTLSFSADTTDTELVFDCEDIGQQSVQLWVTDINGNQDFCATFIVIQDNNPNEGPCGLIDPGIVKVTGQVSTKESQPISGASVDLEDGAAVLGAMTEETGLYAFDNMPVGGSYEIVPSKNDDALNGVSTLDLVLIQKHILGITPLDEGYDRIAADINSSEDITAIDLIELRKLILGVYDEFPNNTSWRFVDKLHEFIDGNDPWDGGFPETYNIDTLSGSMLIDFVGVKIGDINGTAIASLNGNTSSENRSNNDLILQIDNRNISTTASTMRVPLMSTNFKEIEGMQFTLELTDGLELIGLEGASIAMNNSNIQLDESLSTKDKRVYRLSWNDVGGRVVNVDREVPICFMNISTPETSYSRYRQLSESMSITSASTHSEYYKSSRVAGEVVVTFRNEVEDIRTLEAAAMPFALYQSEPNPWTEMTTVGFDLPRDGQVVYRVKDMQGRTLLEQQQYYTAGQHRLTLSQEQLKIASGILILELIYGDEVQSIKMIKIR